MRFPVSHREGAQDRTIYSVIGDDDVQSIANDIISLNDDDVVMTIAFGLITCIEEAAKQ